MNIATWLFTLLKGRQVGSDAAGNRYFIERESRAGSGVRLRRWVLYPGAAHEASLPAGWQAWLHYPNGAANEESARFPWQKPRNRTTAADDDQTRT
jgi:NADH:ubiquinone oxidoreductase subunit